MTEEHLRFLNENLDLVGEYLCNCYHRYIRIPDYKFGQLAAVAFTLAGSEYVDVYYIGETRDNYSDNYSVWKWQPMLKYVEEHANRAPIFK